MKAYELLELARLILRKQRTRKITGQEEDQQVIHLAFAALESVSKTHPESLPEIIRTLIKES